MVRRKQCRLRKAVQVHRTDCTVVRQQFCELYLSTFLLI